MDSSLPWYERTGAGIGTVAGVFGSFIVPEGRAPQIADAALVVRGGIAAKGAQSIDAQIAKSAVEGYNGFSVQCANTCTDVSQLGMLGQYLPNRQLSVITAAEIRAAGGDVIMTGGASPFHATVTGLSGEAAAKLPWSVYVNPNSWR
jgi:hypothetical protein